MKGKELFCLSLETGLNQFLFTTSCALIVQKRTFLAKNFDANFYTRSGGPAAREPIKRSDIHRTSQSGSNDVLVNDRR